VRDVRFGSEADIEGTRSALHSFFYVRVECPGPGHIGVAPSCVTVSMLGKAAAVQRLGVLGIKLDGFVEVGFGIDVVAGVEVKDAATEISAL